MCILSVYTLLKVVGYYDLRMCPCQWMDVSSIQIQNFAKPLMQFITSYGHLADYKLGNQINVHHHYHHRHIYR